MKRQNFGTFGAIAAGAAAMGLCCGIPLLASLGVVGLVAGIGLGSWLLIGVALIVVTAAFARRRRHHQTGSTPSNDAATAQSTCCTSNECHTVSTTPGAVPTANAREDLG